MVHGSIFEVTKRYGLFFRISKRVFFILRPLVVRYDLGKDFMVIIYTHGCGVVQRVNLLHHLDTGYKYGGTEVSRSTTTSSRKLPP